jgi:sec-independent protein translocase protein TatB
MVDLSWSHILIVLMVALVVVGPKDLPRLMRATGRWAAKARTMADQFRKSFDDMARQSELDELRAELESLRHEHPLAEVDRTLRAPVLGSDPKPAPELSSGVQMPENKSAETANSTVANEPGA